MNIAIVSPLVLGIGQTPETYSSQQISLARCWAEQGHQVDVITGNCPGLKEALRHERVRLHERPVLWLGGPSGLPIMLGGGRLLGARHDVVLASEYYQPSTALACLRSQNVVIYQGQNTPGSTAAKRLALRVLEATLVPTVRRRYRLVVAKTNLAADFVGKRGFSRCTVVSSGFDGERFRPPSPEEREQARSRFGLSCAPRVIVYAGQLSPRRDVASAIQGAWALRREGFEVTLLVVGDGPERRNLELLVGSLGLEQAVRFTGHLPWDRLRDAYWAGDVFVFPTQYEIFGMVLLEAMACGLRVVSTGCPAAEDIARACPGFLQLVPVGDPKAIAEGCRRAFEPLAPSVATSVREHLARNDWGGVSRRILHVVATLS